MRGIPSSVTTIRKKVFTEVARLAYDGDLERMEDLPYVIVPGEEAKYRESIFLERAIAGERVRLAMGLPLRPVDQRTPPASPRASARAPSPTSTTSRPSSTSSVTPATPAPPSSTG